MEQFWDPVNPGVMMQTPHFKGFALIAALVCASSNSLQASNRSENASDLVLNAPFSLLQASFIWTDNAGDTAYVAFRKNVSLASVPAFAELSIFADSRYMLWINGRYVLRGPCRFNPSRPEVDQLDVALYLQAGNNTFVVLAHHYGISEAQPNGRIMQHAPGLTAQLVVGEEVVLVTDSTWRCSNSSALLFLPTPRLI